MATLQERMSLFAQRVGTECKSIHEEIGTLANLSTTEKASLVAALNEVNAALSTLSGTVSTNGGDIAQLKLDMDAVEKAVEDLEGVVAAQTNIDDANVGTATTYSSSKIVSEITAAKQEVKNDLLNGAGEAADTLKELADLIKVNEDAIDALEALAAGHVKYTEAQTITDEQKGIARTNIGAASQAAVEAAQTQADKGVTDAAAAKAAADAAQGDVDALDGRVTTAEGEIDTLQSEMDAVEAKAADNEAAISALSTAIGDTDTDLVALFEASLATA